MMDVEAEKRVRLLSPADLDHHQLLQDTDTNDVDDDLLLIRETKRQVVMNQGTYTFHIKASKHFEYEQVQVISTRVLYQQQSSTTKSKEEEGKQQQQQQQQQEVVVEVGYLKGCILPRPASRTPTFHSMANGVGGSNSELQELACLFCDFKGSATRASTNLEGVDVHNGGFFHIEAIETLGRRRRRRRRRRRDNDHDDNDNDDNDNDNENENDHCHQGTCDLGLVMVHETLVFLKDAWTLAVMVSGGRLSVKDQKWPKENNRFQLPRHGHEDHGHEDHDNDVPMMILEQKEGLQIASLELQTHFARMGFVQAGRNSCQHHAWYLTAKSYFGRAGENGNNTNNGNKDEDDAIMAGWKTKDQIIQDLDVFVPPEKHVPTGLDAELHRLLLITTATATTNKEPDLMQLRRMIQSSSSSGVMQRLIGMETLIAEQGASIHNSRALFLAVNAAKDDDKTLRILRALVRLGGNVNQANEHGYTPLHMAAAQAQPIAIGFLLGVGASSESTNDKGHTPLHSLEDYIETKDDARNICMFDEDMSGGAARNIEEVSLRILDSAWLLMPPNMKSVLVDGWMSPRMKELLTISADIAFDLARTSVDDEFVSSGGVGALTPLHKVCMVSFSEYLPVPVLQCNPDGLGMKFGVAWAHLFFSMTEILRRNQTPTVSRIKSEMISRSNNNNDNDAPTGMETCFIYFEQRGGKIEYALDALIRCTEDVVQEEDDLWDYEEFRDQIEDLPKNPLDNLFDLVRAKCLQLTSSLTGGAAAPSMPMGPYDHRCFCQDETSNLLQLTHPVGILQS